MHPTATALLARLQNANSEHELNEVTWDLVEQAQSSAREASHAQAALVVFYTLHFVPRFGRKIQSGSRSGRAIEAADFESAIAETLLDVIQRAETTRGGSFAGYAYFFLKGVVADTCAVDSTKTGPTAVAEHRSVWDAYDLLLQHLARAPLDQEVTDRVNEGRPPKTRLSLEMVQSILRDSGAMSSLDDKEGIGAASAQSSSIGGEASSGAMDADGMPFGLPRFESNLEDGYRQALAALSLQDAQSFAVLATLYDFVGLGSFQRVHDRLAMETPTFPEAPCVSAGDLSTWAALRESVLPEWVPGDWPSVQSLFRTSRGNLLCRRGLQARYDVAWERIQAYETCRKPEAM